MKRIFILFTIMFFLGVSTGTSFAQDPSLATFQETAQVIIDRSVSQQVTASITLQTTSIQEIKIPAELEQRIREEGIVRAVILTNEDQCVLGVTNESCIMINVERNPADKGIIAIQDSSREIADRYIDAINDAFDTKAEFHSVFLQSDDITSRALDTSGVISGRGMVSAVYTMPMEDTSSMYEKISALLIPKIIRDGGGFYNIAKNLSFDENAKMTFSLIPIDSKSLLQLKLAVNYPEEMQGGENISPLEFLQTDTINRSQYFSAGFYPLNSLIQVVILSPEDTNISDVRANIIPTEIIDDEKIPTDITKDGWVFDPEEGQVIQGKFIFGEKTVVDKEELEFAIGGNKLQKEEKSDFDESIIVVAIIAVVAIAAALFYLKGYKK